MLALRISLGIISIFAIIFTFLLGTFPSTNKFKNWVYNACLAISCLAGVTFAIWSITEIFLDPGLVNHLVFAIWAFLMFLFRKNA